MRALRAARVRNGDVLPGWLVIEAIRQGEERRWARAALARRRAAFWAGVLASVTTPEMAVRMRAAG